MRMRRAFLLSVLLVAILRGVGSVRCGPTRHDAVLTALGFVVLTIHITVVRSVATRSEVQPVALLSLHAFRAPSFLLHFRLITAASRERGPAW